jgi:hypothetical protein
LQHIYSNRITKTKKDRQQKRHIAKISLERQEPNLGDRTTETDRQPRRHIRSRDRDKHEYV